MKIRIVNYLL